MSTMDNLAEAFAGESQANRTYLAFAKQAEKDGMAQIAKLFRAVAEAETIHAHAHLRAMETVKGTADNLAAAMSGEEHEFTSMYPAMIETAKAEGNARAERSMTYALEVEKVHYELFKKAAEAANNSADLETTDIMVCPMCGYTVIGNAPDSCPVCHLKGVQFNEVE